MLYNSPQVWHFIIYQLHLHCFYKPACAPRLCTEPSLSFFCAGKIFHPALISSGKATWCAISPAISESPAPVPLPNFCSCIGKEGRSWMHPCWWKFLFGLQNCPMGSEILRGRLRVSLPLQSILPIPMEKAASPKSCVGMTFWTGEHLPGNTSPGLCILVDSHGQMQKGCGTRERHNMAQISTSELGLCAPGRRNPTLRLHST